MARQRASDAQAAFGRIGMAAVPPPVTEPEPEAPPLAPELPARRGVVTPRRRGNAPVAAEAVAFTVRFDSEEAYEDDALVLALRRQLGWRTLDKSALVRALMRLARSSADVQHLALEELRRTGP